MDSERLLMEASEQIEVLERENEVLEAAKLGSELRAAVAISRLEKRIERIEQQFKRVNDFVQGLPNRDDYNAIRQQLSDLSYNVPV